MRRSSFFSFCLHLATGGSKLPSQGLNPCLLLSQRRESNRWGTREVPRSRFWSDTEFFFGHEKHDSNHLTKWKGMCSEVRTSSKSNFSNKFLLLITERKEIEVTVMFEKMYKDIKREDILLGFRKSYSKDSVIWKLKAVQIILSHKEQNFNLKNP